ncbi:hypothetical protein IW138_003648 [Coemansia sp. RSA 986]|nr:hypothetical protein IW138_003648 [Coemansia sp. RSA 986]
MAIPTGARNGQVLKFSYLPKKVKVDSNHYNFVKHVDIDFKGLKQEPSKNNFKDFSNSWPEDLVFPSARSLEIDMTGLVFQRFDMNNADRNERFYWLSKRIKTSMPKLQIAKFGDGKFDNTKFDFRLNVWAFNREWKASDFLSTVFGKATDVTIHIRHTHLVVDYPFMQNSTGLTSLEWGCVSNNSIFSGIVESSASTLETLDYQMPTYDYAKSLVFSDRNVPIVYPRLKNLKLSGNINSSLGRKIRMDKSVTPFPALRSIIWLSLYIFEDDTLFRGNSGTLEHLDIMLGVELADVLQRYNVFSGGKYSQLRNIALFDGEQRFGTILTPRQFVNIAVDFISPATRSLQWNYYCSYRDIMSIATANPYADNIQILELTKIETTVYELAALIKLLPNMVKLSCRPGDGFHRKRASVNKIYKTYYPLSHRLKYWESCDTTDEDIVYAPTTALVLSILCPNLSTVLVSAETKDEYGFRLAEDIESGVYDRHMDRIIHVKHIYI